MPTEAAELVFDEATKVYPGRDGAAVDHLSLTVPAGEICVLVGPSGGGKTTALKLVNRLIPLTSGYIRIDGRQIGDYDVIELRRSIGYVIQQVGLFPHMTIEANIGTVPRLLGWQRQRIRERVGELLELVGLDPEQDRKRFPAELSGGQRQRVGLARALAVESAADADGRAVRRDRPDRPLRGSRTSSSVSSSELRKTVVFVTHDIDEAIKVGDRIAILREGGRLAQYDTPQQILEQPADEFVAEFVGRDRALKALTLRTLGDLELSACAPRTACRGCRRTRACGTRSRSWWRSAATRSWSSAPTARRSASRRARTCCDERPARCGRRPGHPALPARQRVPAEQPLVLPELGARALERHPPAGARPAHLRSR